MPRRLADHLPRGQSATVPSKPLHALRDLLNFPGRTPYLLIEISCFLGGYDSRNPSNYMLLALDANGWVLTALLGDWQRGDTGGPQRRGLSVAPRSIWGQESASPGCQGGFVNHRVATTKRDRLEPPPQP
ncbi:hypothetical protein MHYP_G00255130 [Metynnis hypsauchen]